VSTVHLPIEQIQSALIHEGLAYWRYLCRNGAPPLRADFDPAEIPRLLPYTVLSEIHRDPLRVRYRLVGTRICEVDGWDKTGHWLEDEPWQEHAEQWLEDYRTVIETGAPLFGRDELTYPDKSPIVFEWAVMPLSTDGREIDMCFEIEAFAGEPALVERPLAERTRDE
jgi:hypothetical protein